VRDFDAEVRLFNPYPTTRGNWSYGFSFRDRGDTYYDVLIDSDGNWQHDLTSGGELQALGQGTSDAIDTSEGGSNRLKLMVRGNRGWFYINNQLVTTFDLSQLGQPGDVFVLAYRSLRGETQFKGFTVRVGVVPLGGGPLAGPFYGELTHDEDNEFEVRPVQINVRDFDAEVRLFNPYPTTKGSWNHGFVFRRGLEGTFYAVLIDSDGQWHHDLQHLAAPVDQGTSDAIDTSEGGSNRLRLSVRGGIGWFYINKQLVTTLDLSDLMQPGDVNIVTGYFSGGELPGEATRYRGFTVWGRETVSEADVSLFKEDINDFWSGFFANEVQHYTIPAVLIHDIHEGVVDTPCGPEVGNAFYCGRDHTIHVLREFLQQSFLPAGDFAVAFVLAHEWAHAAQLQLGIFDDPHLWTIQTELQADCLAGVYTNYAIFESNKIEVEPGDVQEAALSAFLVGDPGDIPADDPRAHGSSQQRVDAFYAGFNRGFAPCWQHTSAPGALP
jgi:predicted metalloprotease